MTEQRIAELAPALRDHLWRFREHLGGREIRAHVDSYCRGLLADLPRKSVEPMALAGGQCVRSLQLLLTQHDWDETGVAGLPAALCVARAAVAGETAGWDRRHRLD